MTRSRAALVLAVLLTAVPASASDTYEDARALREAGRLDEAIVLLDETLSAQTGREARLDGLLGLCLADAGRNDRVQRLATRRAGYAGDAADLHLFLGRHALLAGSPETAFPHLERSVALGGRPVEALDLLIDELERQGEFERAAAWAEQLEPHEPERARRRAADLLVAAGDRYVRRAAKNVEAVPRAIERYEEARAKAPDDLRVMAKLYQALLNAKRGKDALELLPLVFPEQRDPAGFRLQTGRCQLALGDIDGAEASFRRAAALDPGRTDVTTDLGRLLTDRGRPAEAVELLQPAATRDPDDLRLQLALGLALSAGGEHARAEAALRRVVELEPRHPEGLYHLGLVLVKQGRADEGRAYLEQFRRLGG